MDQHEIEYHYAEVVLDAGEIFDTRIGGSVAKDKTRRLMIPEGFTLFSVLSIGRAHAEVILMK